ncbi:hypothetical protein PILCRDRAFT_336056 [Piloderma croceum F 1598]|uniref:Uncharacterized protein n=1 Tax=Piloderma croceum (strain F 1598) TaxID=765440 RepID=A0A0C3FPX1_PILCF|nr:hypothetical protein PILCRDRAFT_336056 [Piloderma croceum F 1598]
MSLSKICDPVLSRTECEYCGHHLCRTMYVNMESIHTSLCGPGELSCQIALHMMARCWKHAVHETQQAAVRFLTGFAFVFIMFLRKTFTIATDSVPSYFSFSVGRAL